MALYFSLYRPYFCRVFTHQSHLSDSKFCQTCTDDCPDLRCPYLSRLYCCDDIFMVLEYDRTQTVEVLDTSFTPIFTLHVPVEHSKTIKESVELSSRLCPTLPSTIPYLILLYYFLHISLIRFTDGYHLFAYLDQIALNAIDLAD